jgi:hypothetical protein
MAILVFLDNIANVSDAVKWCLVYEDGGSAYQTFKIRFPFPKATNGPAAAFSIDLE